MPTAPSRPHPETGLMGVVSGGCLGHGETGAGAAAAAATGKEGSGEEGVWERVMSYKRGVRIHGRRNCKDDC